MVDALVSGTSDRKVVWVRVPPSVPSLSGLRHGDTLPRWRNWYTRTFEGRMRQLIRVQVPAWAPLPLAAGAAPCRTLSPRAVSSAGQSASFTPRMSGVRVPHRPPRSHAQNSPSGCPTSGQGRGFANDLLTGFGDARFGERGRAVRVSAPQLTAFFTSAAIRFSSAGVSFVRNQPDGHIVPSSRLAAMSNPNVAYRSLVLRGRLEEADDLAVLGVGGHPVPGPRDEVRRGVP